MANINQYYMTDNTYSEYGNPALKKTGLYTTPHGDLL